MYRFAMDGRVRWPVCLQQVQEDNSAAEATFGVVFTLFTRDELKARDDALQTYGRKLKGLFPTDGEPDTEELAAARDKLTAERVATDDALLRARITGWDSIEDHAGKTIAFSADALDAFLRNQVMRQALLQGLIDASVGAPSKNLLPGRAGMPASAQASPKPMGAS